jgi:hypothetical protein
LPRNSPVLPENLSAPTKKKPTLFLAWARAKLRRKTRGPPGLADSFQNPDNKRTRLASARCILFPRRKCSEMWIKKKIFFEAQKRLHFSPKWCMLCLATAQSANSWEKFLAGKPLPHFPDRLPKKNFQRAPSLSGCLEGRLTQPWTHQPDSLPGAEPWPERPKTRQRKHTRHLRLFFRLCPGPTGRKKVSPGIAAPREGAAAGPPAEQTGRPGRNGAQRLSAQRSGFPPSASAQNKPGRSRA